MANINDEVLIKAKLNSIGSAKKEFLKVRKKEIAKKTLVALCAILMTISISACSIPKYSTDIQKSPTSITSYNIDPNCVTDYKASKVWQLEFEMKYNNMEISVDANNTVEEYNEIKEYLNEDDIIIYYDRLGEIECNKILQTFGYSDINDYMLKNGYVDLNGEPNIHVLRYSTYERITQILTQGTEEKSK